MAGVETTSVASLAERLESRAWASLARNMHDDRRGKQRVPYHQVMKILDKTSGSESVWHEMVSIDVSSQGVRLVCAPCDLQEGQQVVLDAHPGDADPLVIPAFIVRIDKSIEHVWEFGLQFGKL